MLLLRRGGKSSDLEQEDPPAVVALFTAFHKASWRRASTFRLPWLDRDSASAARDPSMHTALALANLASGVLWGWWPVSGCPWVPPIAGQ